MRFRYGGRTVSARRLPSSTPSWGSSGTSKRLRALSTPSDYYRSPRVLSIWWGSRGNPGGTTKPPRQVRGHHGKRLHRTSWSSPLQARPSTNTMQTTKAISNSFTRECSSLSHDSFLVTLGVWGLSLIKKNYVYRLEMSCSNTHTDNTQNDSTSLHPSNPHRNHTLPDSPMSDAFVWLTNGGLAKAR